MDELDIRDLACPGPVLKLRDLLATGETTIRLWVADGQCRTNVERFAASRHATVAVEAEADGSYHLVVRAGDRAAAGAADDELAVVCDLPDVEPPAARHRGPTVVQIAAATMGDGDDELGALLLRSFLKTQRELQHPPNRIVFYNGGVRLCCTGSVLLDDLHSLESSGVEIIACGTCLNFFDLADELAVGRVTDMLEIATSLADAESIIRP
jgi:selenium metabolism protein YedF